MTSCGISAKCLTKRTKGLKNFRELFYGSLASNYSPTILANPERTKQMEQILRAKVKIFFKSENLKECF